METFSDETVNSTSTKSDESFLEYHFHTYFHVDDPKEVAHAIKLRNEIIANCVQKKIVAIPLHYNYDADNPLLEYNNDTTGLNMQPVGPHPIGSFETWVPVEYFSKAYEWFLQNRGPLSIFIHPLTKQELVDHTKRIVFMGSSYTLNTASLRELIPNFTSQYPNQSNDLIQYDDDLESSYFRRRPTSCLNTGDAKRYTWMPADEEAVRLEGPRSICPDEYDDRGPYVVGSYPPRSYLSQSSEHLARVYRCPAHVGLPPPPPPPVLADGITNAPR
ncbi:DOPA 4,5-dioxygenase [Pseudolycoriella hygida]|uniref:DOPA 4,5-dioxygenase n=1 Tax=Pseudolycoriella hygida TaxID=35572 RepID=A0A9Q0S9H1_9DIPT|nr:DOPA 4,5-dioxygenase [Pseudolycoriella hygida]